MNSINSNLQNNFKRFNNKYVTETYYGKGNMKHIIIKEIRPLHTKSSLLTEVN